MTAVNTKATPSHKAGSILNSQWINPKAKPNKTLKSLSRSPKLNRSREVFMLWSTKGFAIELHR
jgi:hypothetical protein